MREREVLYKDEEITIYSVPYEIAEQAFSLKELIIARLSLGKERRKLPIVPLTLLQGMMGCHSPENAISIEEIAEFLYEEVSPKALSRARMAVHEARKLLRSMTKWVIVTISEDGRAKYFIPAPPELYERFAMAISLIVEEAKLRRERRELERMVAGLPIYIDFG